MDRSALPLRPNGRRATVLPPQPIPGVQVVRTPSWSHRQDRVAGAMAESDGWVWANLDRKRRDYWRNLAAKAMSVLEEGA